MGQVTLHTGPSKRHNRACMLVCRSRGRGLLRTRSQAEASLGSEVLMRMRLKPARSITLNTWNCPFFLPSHSRMQPCQRGRARTSHLWPFLKVHVAGEASQH